MVPGCRVLLWHCWQMNGTEVFCSLKWFEPCGV